MRFRELLGLLRVVLVHLLHVALFLLFLLQILKQLFVICKISILEQRYRKQVLECIMNEVLVRDEELRLLVFAVGFQ